MNYIYIYTHINNSLLIRLRLVVPFASLIWEHPKEDECDILEWIRVLVPLLGVSLFLFYITINIYVTDCL